MIALSINLDKLDDSRIIEGKKGHYVNLVLFDRQDDYGNDGFVAESVTKEERLRGVKGDIVGNWRNIG